MQENKMKIFFGKVGKWFRSLFVAENGNEAKLVTLLKKDGTQSILSSLLCALLGIFVGFIILLCINAEHAGEAMAAILKNFLNFSSRPKLMAQYLGSTIVKSVPLIMCGLSVLFAYKAGLFNIGVGGQYCIGICVSLYAALSWELPWYACVILAMVAAGLWGAISGAFKAFFNVNEVIACIMTNWIALYLTNIILKGVMNPSTSETYPIPTKSIIPDIGLRNAFNNNKYVTIAILFTIVIAIIIQIVLSKTTFGYELKATGNNKFAAKYAGMKDKRNIILTMAISGALAGLAASFYYLTGIENYQISSSVPAMGFNGIAVAFLGGLNPIGVVFAGFFVEHITLGGGYVNTNYYNPQVADLMVAIIIYLCAFVLFFKQFLKRRLARRAEKVAAVTDDGNKPSEDADKKENGESTADNVGVETYLNDSTQEEKAAEEEVKD